jgi:hypothetical protein
MPSVAPQYWDAPLEQQTKDAANPRIVEFSQKAKA